MLFKIVNEGANRHSHCGVLEFSAPEGSCYMPYWVSCCHDSMDLSSAYESTQHS